MCVAVLYISCGRFIQLLLVLLLGYIKWIGLSTQVPCDQALLCPNTTAEFTCEFQNIATMTCCSNDMQLELLLAFGSKNYESNTIDIYTATIIEGSDSHIFFTLTFNVPINMNINNMEIICAKGAGNNGDKMSCPFVIAGLIPGIQLL